MFGGMNQGQNPMAGRDVGGELKEWISKIPAFTRFIAGCLIVTYILSWFLTSYINKLTLQPIPFILSKQFWRIFTCTFVCIHLIGFLIICCMFLPRSFKRERSLGSVRYLIFFLMNNFVGQVMYVAMYWLLWQLPWPTPEIQTIGETSSLSMRSGDSYSNGLWVLIMMEMTIRGLINPDAETYLCLCPCAIKAKVMPWLFFGLFSVFRFSPAWDMLAGIFLGYLHSWGRMEWTKLSDETALRIQDWFIFKWLKSLSNYIATEDSEPEEAGQSQASYQYQAGDGSQQAAPPSAWNQQSQPSGQQGFPAPGGSAPEPPRPRNDGFVAFQGKGNVLGD